MDGMRIFGEGGARFYADEREVVSADMGVFYNPVMRENRDLSLLVLSWLASRKKLRRIVFPMAASGVRPLRLLEELDLPACELFINDLDTRAIEAARSSLDLNERASSWSGTIRFSDVSAQSLLASMKRAEYIEIDPFGSPIEFLDSALQRIAHKGVLAVSATDTAALCGTYPKTGLRRYAAFTKRSPLMHEHAARILAHVVERNAARYDRSARVVFAYASLHYIKLFFEIGSSKSDALGSVSDGEFWDIDAAGFALNRSKVSNGYVEGMIGPLCARSLFDPDLIAHADDTSIELSGALRSSIATIGEQARVGGGSIDLHVLSSQLGLVSVPRTSALIERLGSHRAARTHFCETAITTTASHDEIREAMSR